MTKVPKDLGLKVEDREQKFWKEAKGKCEETIRNLKHEIEINECILREAESRLNSKT